MREEIQILSRAVDDSERIACVGASGCGKTSVIRELLNSRRSIRQRQVIFDPFQELPGFFCSSEASAVSALSSGPFAKVRVGDAKIFSELVFLALEAKGCLVIADEAHLLLPGSGRVTPASSAMLDLVTWGRHSKCPLIWATQSPGRCSYSLTDNSTGARVVGNLSSPNSLSRIVDWDLDKKQVRALPRYELLLSVPGSLVRAFRSKKM